MSYRIEHKHGVDLGDPEEVTFDTYEEAETCLECMRETWGFYPPDIDDFDIVDVKEEESGGALLCMAAFIVGILLKK